MLGHRSTVRREHCPNRALLLTTPIPPNVRASLPAAALTVIGSRCILHQHLKTHSPPGGVSPSLAAVIPVAFWR